MTRTDFEKLDREDQLASFRREFHIPQGVIYMDGNSLGAMPKAVLKRVGEVTEREWGHHLIKSWNTVDWFNAPHRIGDKIAPIIGADIGAGISRMLCGTQPIISISALEVGVDIMANEIWQDPKYHVRAAVT